MPKPGSPAAAPGSHPAAPADGDHLVVLMPLDARSLQVGTAQRIVSVAMPVALFVMNVGLAAYLGLTRTSDPASLFAAIALLAGAYVAARLAWVAWSFRAGRASMLDARVRHGELQVGLFQGVFKFRTWIRVDRGSTVTVRCAPAEPPHALTVTASGGRASVGSNIAWDAQCHARLVDVAKPFGVTVRRES